MPICNAICFSFPHPLVPRVYLQLPAKSPAQHNAGKQVGSHSILPRGTQGLHGAHGTQGTQGTHGIVPQGIVDLATIGSKITALQYETPWDFAMDVNRMTENSAYFYNNNSNTNNTTGTAVDEKKDHNAPPSASPSGCINLMPVLTASAFAPFSC